MINRTTNYEVKRKAGKLVLVNIVNGKTDCDYTVRASIIKKAYEAGEIIQLNDVGRPKRISAADKTKIVELAKESKKKNFRLARGIKTEESIFTNLVNLTKMVGRGFQPSLIVTGLPGMGKTYVVKETLERFPNGKGGTYKEGVDFIHIKGKATAAGLFVALYEYSDKTIIFDDCDSVLNDDDAIELLKGALDSYDKRTLTYISQKPLKDFEGQKVPRQFDFEGKVIFITNLPQAKVDPALKSRSFVADVTLTTSQMFTRIERLMETIESRIPMKTKRVAMGLLKQAHEEYQGINIDMRSFIKASRICALNMPNTYEMIVEQICVD